MTRLWKSKPPGLNIPRIKQRKHNGRQHQQYGAPQAIMLCLVIMVCITSHYIKIGLLYRTLGNVDYIYQNETISNKMTVNFLRGLWTVAPHYRPHAKTAQIRTINPLIDELLSSSLSCSKQVISSQTQAPTRQNFPA